MLTELRALDFRLFERLEFEPAPGMNVLVGRNAQGKTSVLEAVCLLLRLQSPRTTTPAQCVRHGAARFALDGRFRGRHLRLTFGGRLKRFELDSKPQGTVSDYLAVGKVAWMANTDLDLVRGGGASRRRYLDFLGVQLVPGYLGRLRTYERALRSRNALLRHGAAASEVAAFDGPLCASGDVLLRVRAHLSGQLLPFVAEAHRAIAGGGNLLMAYQPGSESSMGEALAGSAAIESRQRVTVVGPHRDDWRIELEGRDAGSFASEGQQRSIALALKLAQARLLAEASGFEPLYLIDDVFGELDRNRRNNLLRALPEGAQKIVTTTALDWWEGGGEIFRVEGGRLAPGIA